MPNIIQPVRARTTLLARQWAAAVRAAGGGFENNSMTIANSFSSVIVRKSYYPKIKYLLPMLGIGINAARIPLIDALGVGASTSNNFVDADFSQSTGLQGNGSNKWLDCSIKPSQLGSSNNGGFGWWETNISFGGNVEAMGCYNAAQTERYVIDLRSTLQAFRWGNAGNSAQQNSTAANGHYYGQRLNATSRIIYFNGISIATNTTSDSATGASDTNIRFVGANGGDPAWPGRCGITYLTDGTLTDAEITDFNSVISSYLMKPSGKI